MTERDVPAVPGLPAGGGPSVAGLIVAGLSGGGLSGGGLSGGGLSVVERAVAAAGLSFTVSDPHLPDNPLVYVNAAFERTTGYPAEQVLGRNCRFLQGPQTDPAAVRRIRQALARQEPAVVVLCNQRRDGSPFWNELSLAPVHDDGRLTHVVGIQADVTERVLGEQQRQRHLAEAERAQRRLSLLAEATSQLAATLDVEQSLRRLTDLVVPLLADWCVVELADDTLARGTAARAAAAGDSPAGGGGRPLVGAHADPALADLLRGALRPGGPAVRRVLSTGTAVRYDRPPDDLAGTAELADLQRRLGLSSVLVVPLRARRQVLGAVTLVRADPDRPRFDDDDLAIAADLARRAALTVDNARLFQREHAVAEQLQRSLLPVLPDVPGLDLAARYRPGSTAAKVGGDWYDLFVLPDGTVGLAVGDVMGHDLAAAAAMGQLRSVLRSYAWQGEAPSRVLDSLDRLVQGLAMAQLATAVYGRLELPGPGPTAGTGRLTLADAGHLPVVLRTPDGTARLLDGAPSLLVGAALGQRRDELVVDVPAGSTLVLYTDGLVERRGLDPDEGLERLRAAVEAADGSSAQALCDALLRDLAGDEREDDTALLVVRVR